MSELNLKEILTTQVIENYSAGWSFIDIDKCTRDIELFLNSDTTALALCMPPTSGKTSLAIAAAKHWVAMNEGVNVFF